MSEERSVGQVIRLGAGILGLCCIVTFFWLRGYFRQSDQVIERVNPDEMELKRDADHEIEGVILHFGIPLIVIGLEAIFIAAGPWIAEGLPKRRRDRIFRLKPRIRRKTDKLPLLITSDIDACLTPPARDLLELRNIQKIRQYCNFVQAEKGYPPFILVSARAQEYTELMCQTLGLVSKDRDIPCVLENGMAIYAPYARTVKIPDYVTDDMNSLMEKARACLKKFEQQYEFEPKRYMITINVEKQRQIYQDDMEKRKAQIIELRQLLENELRSCLGAEYNLLNITSTVNAVDIVPNGVSKLKGLEEVISFCNNNLGMNMLLENVASIGNSEADEPVLAKVGQPFCALLEAHGIVKLIVTKRTSWTDGLKKKSNVLNEESSTAVVEMIQRVTGLELR